MRKNNQKNNADGHKGIHVPEQPAPLFPLAKELNLEEIIERVRLEVQRLDVQEKSHAEFDQPEPNHGEGDRPAGLGHAIVERNPELSLEEIMRRVKAEVIRRRDESVSAVSQQQVEYPGQPQVERAGGKQKLPRWEPRKRPLPTKQEYVLGDFLQFSDADFLESTYRSLLRRPADAFGREHFLAALRAGELSKVEVLGLIRFSEEGKRCGVHVDGLLLPYKLHRWRRARMIGPALSFAMAIVRLPRLVRHVQALENAAVRESQGQGRLINRIADVVEGRLAEIDHAVNGLHAELLQSLTERTDSLQMLLDAQSEGLRVYKDERNQLDQQFLQRLAEQRSATSRLSDELLGKQSEQEAIARVASSNYENRRSILDIQRRLMTFLDAASKQAAGPAADTHEERNSADDGVLNAQYVSFEDEFRGEREDIKTRAAHYLGTLASGGVEPANGVVLDLGCGRGEWLELLTERGYICRGVDLNNVMLEDSLARGFDVVEADAVEYLRGLADDSLAAITSMHLVEHLPYNVLIRLLDEAIRVLRPGGVLILETPNPENITVGSCWFYLDPTHRNPIPPDLLQWTVRARGFSQPVVERLAEYRGVPDIQRVSEDVPGAAQINLMAAWFTTAPDYAVIARKPSPVQGDIAKLVSK